MRALSFAAGIAGALVCASAAHAQNVDFGKRIYHDKAVCSYCHGWAGDGAGEGQSSGGAADLRKTPLDRAQLIEVIKCGIPGKAMPHFDEAAYTDKRCYNSTEADMGANKPPLPPGSVLSQREIEALARSAVSQFESFELTGTRTAGHHRSTRTRTRA